MSGNHGTASKDIGKQIPLKLIETHAYYSVIWFKMRTSLNVAAYGHNVWNLIYHSVVFSWYLQSYSCHIKTFGKNCHNDFERQKNSFESEHFVKKKDLQSVLLVYPRCFWHVYLKLIRHLKNNKCFQNSLSVNIVYLAGIFTIIQKQEVNMNSVDLRWTWMQLTYNDQNKLRINLNLSEGEKRKSLLEQCFLIENQNAHFCQKGQIITTLIVWLASVKERDCGFVFKTFIILFCFKRCPFLIFPRLSTVPRFTRDWLFPLFDRALIGHSNLNSAPSLEVWSATATKLR